jgi:hypothetical protein
MPKKAGGLSPKNSKLNLSNQVALPVWFANLIRQVYQEGGF